MNMTANKNSTFLFILLALITLNSWAQSNSSSGIVSYSYYSNLGRATQSDWDLLFEGDKSIFMGGGNLKFVGPETAKGPNDRSFELKVNGQLTPHIINDFVTDSIYSQGLVFREPYYVKDYILNPKWTIHSDSKNISGFSCKKATTTFRGRNYEVWFTPEIPVNFGPWKLNGLPGLILLATDDRNQIEFRATKIRLNEDIDIDAQIAVLPKLGEEVSLQEYVSQKDTEGEQLSKYISSKVSRGGNSTSSFEAAGRESQIEIIYEWEVE